MSMTFDSLVIQVKNYLERDDATTVSEIPNFINQAQQRICRESKNIGLEQYVTGNFVPGVFTYAKPARWRRNITFNCGTGPAQENRSSILLRSYEFLISYWPDRTKTGTPDVYSDYGYYNFIVAPTPDTTYPFEFSYLEIPATLSVVTQTNWLTDFAPDVLLYATLLEAMPYLKNDERMPVWKEMYGAGIASLNAQDDLRVVDRQSSREAD
jgi:hypothetical protein